MERWAIFKVAALVKGDVGYLKKFSLKDEGQDGNIA